MPYPSSSQVCLNQHSTTCDWQPTKTQRFALEEHLKQISQHIRTQDSLVMLHITKTVKSRKSKHWSCVTKLEALQTYLVEAGRRSRRRRPVTNTGGKGCSRWAPCVLHLLQRSRPRRCPPLPHPHRAPAAAPGPLSRLTTGSGGSLPEAS